MPLTAFQVVFIGEVGIDEGGPRREFWGLFAANVKRPNIIWMATITKNLFGMTLYCCITSTAVDYMDSSAPLVFIHVPMIDRSN